MSELNRRQSSDRGPAEIYDVVNGWCQDWYFQLRVQEEISRAHRYELPLTVAVIRLNQDWNPDTEPCASVLSAALNQLRGSDLAGITGMSEVALCLTHTTSEQAEVVLRRLAPLFARYEPAIGLASLNEESSDSEPLLAMARRGKQQLA